MVPFDVTARDCIGINGGNSRMETARTAPHLLALVNCERAEVDRRCCRNLRATRESHCGETSAPGIPIILVSVGALRSSGRSGVANHGASLRRPLPLRLA